MKSWKTPTPNEVDKAVALLVHGEHHRYFFDRLENPKWLAPLKAKGFFGSPPAPIHDESKATIAFPIWPESRYLARMAAFEPRAVIEILLQIPATENVRVHDDFADAALAMPPAVAAEMVPEVIKWLRRPYQVLLPQKLGALVSHLAKGGEVAAALALARVLLDVRADPRATQKDIEEHPLFFPIPQGHFDAWNYQQILSKNIPDLEATAGEDTLTLLCDLLDRALHLSRRDDETPEPEDYSYIWRPAIDRGRSDDRDVRDLLVSAVRDVAEKLCERAPSVVGKVVESLEARPWHVFQRLALHVLRLFADTALVLVVNRLGDPARFDQPAFRREYNLLAEECFGRLDTVVQHRVLAWIEKGLNLDFVKTRLAEFAGRPVSDEEATLHVKQWQRDRLAPLAADLPENWKARYDRLIKELGPGREAGAASVQFSVGGAFAPQSPVGVKDLRELTIDELIKYLQSWVPNPEPMGESREGLGMQLGALIGTEPERYSGEFRRFIGLDPTYVRAALQALWVPVKEKRSIAWAPVVHLSAWVIDQGREITGRKGGWMDQDPDWGATRDAVTNLLSEGFDHDSIPLDLRQQAWGVLEGLTEDSMPTPEDDARYGQDVDPATHSANTTRGKAMQAVIRYALWVRRHPDGEHGCKTVSTHGFDDMPEVRAVLDKHLDPQYERSRAIRVVYGQWFATLYWLDPTWTKARIKTIFPRDEGSRSLWNVAWGAYVIFCQPYNEMFDALVDEYRSAIAEIGVSAEDWKHLGNRDSRLAEHLMVEYWWAHIDWQNPEGLLAAFYSKADPKLRGWAIEFLGRSLNNTSTTISVDALERLKSLWYRRLETVRAAGNGSPEAEELRSFAWWFVSKRFEDDWALAQLRETLMAAGTIGYDHMVVERLAELSIKMPVNAVECLSMIVKGDKEGWAILGWREHARTILAAAMGSGDPGARKAAVELAHYLGRRGYFEFKDLLPQASAG